MPTRPRKWLARLKDGLRLNGDHRLYYHLGRPNFGDDVNPWFFRRISGRDFQWGEPDRPHVMGIGSMAAKMTRHSVVMGAGFIRPLRRAELVRPSAVVAVRGQLSAEICGGDIRFLGDPMSLVDLLLPADPAERDAPLGFVPHAVYYEGYREMLRQRRPEVMVIDPRGEPLAVITQIARCRRLASQSLHGLIVADAYCIPAVWIEPAELRVGGDFKFRDYFSTMTRPRTPVDLRAFIEGSDDLPWEVAAYRHDKHAYLRRLTEALSPNPW